MALPTTAGNLLSGPAQAALGSALRDANLTNEVATLIQNGQAAAASLVGLGLSGYSVAIVRAVTTTTLTGLNVGDICVDVTTVTKNSSVSAMTCAVANTLPYTPTSGDVIIVLRAQSFSFALPAATNFTF